MSDLRFVGDMNVWIGGVLALAGAYLAWWMYRREVNRGVSPHLAWSLPALRAVAVFLIIMMLTGPVLHHRQIIGQLGRVLMFVDASRSMSVDDRHLDAGRKLLIAQQRSWLPPGTIDTTLADLADDFAEAQRLVTPIQNRTAGAPGVKETATKFAALLAEAGDQLRTLEGKPLPAPPAALGSILRETWRDIPGNVPDDLLKRTDLLDKPAARDTLTQLQTPHNFGDNYAQRLRGYIHPPATGDYTFIIASDDESQLWLSASDNPGLKQPIARSRNFAPINTWPEGENRSRPVRLEAGRRYYIEVVHKEGSGDDWVGVGWTMPDGTQERPIPGSRVSPFNPGTAADGAAVLARFQDELLKPAQALASRSLGDDKATEEARSQLITLSAAAAGYEQMLRQAFAAYGQELAGSGDRVIQSAIARFDGMSRYGRVESMLLDAERGLLATLQGQHHIELIAMRGPDAQRLWNEADPAGMPDQLAVKPDAIQSDLVTAVRARMTAAREGVRTELDAGDEQPAAPAERTAVVLVSDGQHNEGPSPVQLAQLLGNQQVPLYTVAMGSAQPPHDLALLKVLAPESVSKDDRLRGEVVLKDHMPVGQPFSLRIEHEGQIVWEKQLTTQDVSLRKVAFDLPIDKLVEAKLGEADRDVKITALPMAMTVSVSALDGEARPDNNAAPLHFRATTQQWRMLIVDGRARWETRYLRNVVERDERWTVNTVFAGPGAERDALARGEGEGMFPAEKEQLLAYDLIILGEVPPGLFLDKELEWIREFVQNRAGGLILLDGQRGHLHAYADSPIGPLIPVEWPSAGGPSGVPEQLALTEIGRSRSALVLAGDSTENAELWKALPAPRWIAAAQVRPGTGEVLAEAVYKPRGDDNAAEQRVPMMVERRFGAGKVLYLGTDELWRWRFEVADRFHTRFWHQLASDVMEPPYAVADQFVSLDPGKIRYRPGDAAELRVRLRDSDGKPVLHATAEALIERSGQQVATVMLDPDPNQGGVFRGRTPALVEGEYEVSVRVTGFPENQLKARTSFVVEPIDAGEMALLVCNEDLMRQMAETSGGRFLREEQSGDLAKLLEPLSAGRVVESETALWQSYWWFLPIVGLLSVEWFLRKRSGML